MDSDPQGTAQVNDVADEMARLGEVMERLAGAEPGARGRILAYVNSKFAEPKPPRVTRGARRA